MVQMTTVQQARKTFKLTVHSSGPLAPSTPQQQLKAVLFTATQSSRWDVVKMVDFIIGLVGLR